MDCKNWSCCKEAVDMVLKVVFVGAYCWGMCNLVCSMKSCSSSQSCCKAQTQEVVKQCGTGCVKACCTK